MAKSNRTVVVTDATSKSNNEAELTNNVKTLANAMKGTYGDGEWDGGIEGDGIWHKYAMYWDAKLVATFSGSVAIRFPYTLVDSIVKSYDTVTHTLSTVYVNGTDTVTMTGNGHKYIIEVALVRNTKEK